MLASVSAHCLLRDVGFLLRLLTDANLPGTEKISTTVVPPEFLEKKKDELPACVGGVLLSDITLHFLKIVSVLFRCCSSCCKLQAVACWLHFRLDFAKAGNADA